MKTPNKFGSMFSSMGEVLLLSENIKSLKKWFLGLPITILGEKNSKNQVILLIMFKWVANNIERCLDSLISI